MSIRSVQWFAEDLMQIVYSPIRALSRSISASISDWSELLAAPAAAGGRLLEGEAGPAGADGAPGGPAAKVETPEGGPPALGTAAGGPPVLGIPPIGEPPIGGPPDGGPPEGGPPDGGPPAGGPPEGRPAEDFGPAFGPDGLPGAGIPTLVGPAVSVSASTVVPDMAASFLR
jgi:hypothetical protein